MRKMVFGGIAGTVMILASAAMAQQAVDLSAWAGEWHASAEQQINIEADKKALVMEGFASWGASDPERAERGGVNVGEFSVRVPRSWIDGDRLVFIVGADGAEPVGMVEDYDCIIEMQLAGEVLMVGDNNMCGGMNVTFSGQYRRG